MARQSGDNFTNWGLAPTILIQVTVGSFFLELGVSTGAYHPFIWPTVGVPVKAIDRLGRLGRLFLDFVGLGGKDSTNIRESGLFCGTSRLGGGLRLIDHGVEAWRGIRVEGIVPGVMSGVDPVIPIRLQQ